MPETDNSIFNPLLPINGGGNWTIKDANAKLTALLDAVVDGLIIFDREGKIELFNHAAQKIFLYSSQEVLGKNIKLLMPRLYSDNPLSSCLDCDETKIIDKGKKVIGKKPNGDEFPAFFSVGKVDGSSHVQFVGIIRDISEQERDRLEAQESRQRLSHASTLSSMGELSAGIAHEMNQPLSAISTYAQVSKRLLLAGSKINDEKVVTILDKICDQAIRAGDVINRLRNVVKKRVAQRESVDLNKLILETVNLAKEDTRILDHEVILNLNQFKQPKLLADPVQVQQVLLNLIRNSIDAMEHIKGAPLRIQSQWLSEDLIEVSVIDCGYGIDKEMGKKIFTPFMTTKISGMGMGLPDSQTIIHAHGGRIYYDTRQPKGCIFSFSLPAIDINKE